MRLRRFAKTFFTAGLLAFVACFIVLFLVHLIAPDPFTIWYVLGASTGCGLGTGLANAALLS